MCHDQLTAGAARIIDVGLYMGPANGHGDGGKYNKVITI